MLVCNYNPHKTLVKDSLECISKEIVSLSAKYDNVLIMLGNVISEALTTFCQKHLKNDITCYKNPNKLS